MWITKFFSLSLFNMKFLYFKYLVVWEKESRFDSFFGGRIEDVMNSYNEWLKNEELMLANTIPENMKDEFEIDYHEYDESLLLPDESEESFS